MPLSDEAPQLFSGHAPLKGLKEGSPVDGKRLDSDSNVSRNWRWESLVVLCDMAIVRSLVLLVEREQGGGKQDSPPFAVQSRW